MRQAPHSHTDNVSLLRKLSLRLSLLVCLIAGHAQAQAAGSTLMTEPAATDNVPLQQSALRHWWFGGYYRHMWIPKFVSAPWLSHTPSFSNDGFGGLITYKTDGSLNIQFGAGYMPYHFQGAVLQKGNPDEDTEIVRSDLGLYSIDFAVLWDLNIHEMLTVQLGVGVDFGFLTGKLRRDEAYRGADGQMHRCNGPGDPATRVDPNDPTSPMYCAEPRNGSGVTDPDNVRGEQYGVVDSHVPPVLGYLSLPQIGLVFKPWKHMMIKAEAAFGLATIWVGASLHFSLGMFAREPVVLKAAAKVEPPKPPIMGRVLGRVEDADGIPISAVGVTMVGAFDRRPLISQPGGTFVVEQLSPGPVIFELQHDDYQTATCETRIPDVGGDVSVSCKLALKPTEGSISGTVKTEAGEPVANVVIDVTGPKPANVTVDSQGAFALKDVPPGSYQLRVESDDYLLVVTSVEVPVRGEATASLVLAPRPKNELVKVAKEEIVITQQIQFATGKAEIRYESNELMNAIASTMQQYPYIELVEIQGHTDNRGSHKRNMKLSQARAEAVMNWLISAGVQPSRLEARGYGPDVPVASNKTKDGRATNRRVQFMIKRQSR